MTITAIQPSFAGYIKIKDSRKSQKFGDIYECTTQRIFNTNSIAIEEKKYDDDPPIVSILYQNNSYTCPADVDINMLQKAILKADANPDKIINVQSRAKNVDYQI